MSYKPVFIETEITGKSFMPNKKRLIIMHDDQPF
jgi:hypothetical protein